MKKDVVEMKRRVEEHNNCELERISELPDLFKAFVDWDNGNPDTLSEFFYNVKKVVDNKIEFQFKFADGKLHNQLYRVWNYEYRSKKDKVIPAQVGGRKVSFKQKQATLTWCEFMTEFYTWLLVANEARGDLMSFADYIKMDDDKRHTGNREEDNVLLRSYIISSFKNDLKQILFKRDGMVEKQVDGEKYYTKLDFDTVSFEDVIRPNKDDYDTDYLNEFYATETVFDNIEDESLEDNEFTNRDTEQVTLLMTWRELLTDNQVEKIEQLLKWMLEVGEKECQSLFDQFDNTLIQSEAAKIWYPDEWEINNANARKKASKLINNIKSRVSKKLNRDVAEDENKLKSGYYIEELSQEDNYTYHNYLKEWVTEQELHDLKNGNNTINNLVAKYNIDKKVGKDFHYRSEPVFTYIHENKVTSEDNIISGKEIYISEDEVNETIAKMKLKLLERIKEEDGVIFYRNSDGLYEMSAKKGVSKVLLPMLKEDLDILKRGVSWNGSIRRKLEIINTYWNDEAVNYKSGRYVCVSESKSNIKDGRTYKTPEELAKMI